jgi:Fe2+ transport system protein FeoA
MTSLATLPLRSPARIVAVGGGRAFRRRLLELGFLPGVEVRVLGVAPMGDPLDIELRGCRFSIRTSEAAAVDVAVDLADSVAAK